MKSWEQIDWDYDQADQDEDEEAWHKWHRAQTRTLEWNQYVEEKQKERGFRCAICDCVGGGKLTVHHIKYLDWSVNLWEYPDDLIQLVHVGACHRKADGRREDEVREAEWARERIARGGWEDDTFKPLNEEESREFAKHKKQFEKWVWVEFALDEVEGPIMWSLEDFWKSFGKEFLKSIKPLQQRELALDEIEKSPLRDDPSLQIWRKITRRGRSNRKRRP